MVRPGPSLGLDDLKKRLQGKQNRVMIPEVTILVLQLAKRHRAENTFLSVAVDISVGALQQNKGRRRPALDITNKFVETLAVDFRGVEQVEFPDQLKFGVHQHEHSLKLLVQHVVLLQFRRRGHRLGRNESLELEFQGGHEVGVLSLEERVEILRRAGPRLLQIRRVQVERYFHVFHDSLG